MKRLQDWLAKEAKRQAAFPRLEHALLTDRAFGYVYYRLKYMWLRVLVRSAVHLLELTLLATAVPEDWLLIFIGYRTSIGLLSGLYWGALEQLRETVRGHLRRRNPGSARLVIHNWLRLSAVLGVVGIAAVSIWISVAPSEFDTFSVFDLFGMACFARLGFDLWARALHSGVFASRRVYRPVWSLLVPDLVEIMLLIVLFPPFGLLAFVAMIVGGGCVRIGLSNHFSRRAYRSARVEPPTAREALTARNVLSWRDVWLSLKFALSNASSQLDAVIIMLLLMSGTSGQADGITFAGVYYVLRPLMAVAHSWVRTFYFDFKRIDGQSKLFQDRFRALMSRTAVVLAGVVVVLVLLAATLLSGGRPPSVLLLLAPFFVARSLLSLRQLDAFTSSQHAVLLRVSFGLLLSLNVCAWWLRDEAWLMLAATVLMVVGFFLLPSQSLARPEGRVIGLARWLSRLERHATSVRLTVLTIDRRLTTAPRMIRRLASQLEGGVFTRFGRSYVLVFETTSVASLGSPSAAGVLGDGALVGFRSVVADSGTTALRAAFAEDVLPLQLRAMFAAAHTSDLVADYRRLCPTGTVIDASRGRVSYGGALGARELRAIMSAVAIQARGGTERSGGSVEVSVFAPCGEPEVIFVSSSDASPGPEFAHRVQAATLRASLRDTSLGVVAQPRP